MGCSGADPTGVEVMPGMGCVGGGANAVEGVALGVAGGRSGDVDGVTEAAGMFVMPATFSARGSRVGEVPGAGDVPCPAPRGCAKRKKASRAIGAHQKRCIEILFIPLLELPTMQPLLHPPIAAVWIVVE